MTKKSSISIEFTPEFRRKLQKLRKLYRSIQLDLQPLLETLSTGQIVGDKISG